MGHILQFGSGDGEHIKLELRDVGTKSEGRYRGVEMKVDLAAGGFRGSAMPFAFFGEFERLAAGLDQLNADLKTTVVFAPLENEIRLVLEGDGKGHILVSGFVADTAVHELGTVCHFHIRIDQTYLPPLIKALRNFLRAYS